MVNILFGIHCHQPVENFYDIVDEATDKAYRPFLEVASRYPKFKFSVHYSGWLLEYISKYHKLTFKLLQKLSESGQIEFFTSGFYEPILSAIPPDDRKLQIEKLNRFIKDNFGQNPKGLWLTERVWDPSIIEDMADLGVEYVVVDDYHFLSSGFKKDELYGYYITENNGYKVNVFPIDKNLRYTIPFSPIEKIEDYLDYIGSLGEDLAAIIFDDGEKFGIWPGTYEWVYGKRWLQEFLERFTDIKTVRFGLYKDYVKEKKPSGLAYLPITSYQEMGEWSLPSSDFILMEEAKEILNRYGKEEIYERLVKGGIWKNFFVKYPEANSIHKRVLNLSKDNRELKKNDQFVENLLKAQCNDVLWHGIFGGLYLPNLRDNAYRFIIKAEKEVERIKGIKKLEFRDYNFDGNDEVKFSTSNLIVILTSKGGQITELSVKDAEFNFQNVLSRYSEGYHYRLLKQQTNDQEDNEAVATIHQKNVSITDKIREMIIHDWHTKNSFVDHFTNGIDLESFKRENFRDISDFTLKSLNTDYIGDKITLKGYGYIHRLYNATLIKDFKVKDDFIECRVRFDTDYPEKVIYLCEFNLHFATIPEYFSTERDNGTVNKFIIEDIYTKKNIIFDLDKDVRCLSYPIFTVNQSEKGIDTIIQGLTIGFLFDFELNFDLNIKLSIK